MVIAIDPKDIDEFYRLDLEFQQPEFRRKRARYDELASRFRAAFHERAGADSFVAQGTIASLWISAKGEKSELDQAAAFRAMRKAIGPEEIFKYFRCSIEGARDVLGRDVVVSLVTTTRAGIRHLQVVAKQDQSAAAVKTEAAA